MLRKKIKSYGEQYSFTKVKANINKRTLLKIIIAFLFAAEMVLGVLWALGY